MWELTKSFRFEAAHALSGTTFGEASEEIHGHSFRTEVTVRGTPDPETGMVLDLGLLEQRMAEVQKALDHKLLNRIEALGPPALLVVAGLVLAGLLVIANPHWVSSYAHAHKWFVIGALAIGALGFALASGMALMLRASGGMRRVEARRPLARPRPTTQR